MAGYYINPYTPPGGVTNSDQVRALQQQLNAQGAGLRVDGIYGPKTNAAYSAYNGGSTGNTSAAQSYLPADYKAILSEVQGLVKPGTINYSPMSRGDIEAGLRPTYDIAIQQRQGQTATNKANIDVDAASRGMGRSTWVSDVKNRQQNAEASDIASIEAGYAQQLMAALQAEKQNQFAADQFNAQAQAQALQTALGLAGDMYGQRLAQQQASSKSGGRRSSSSANSVSALYSTDYDWDAIFADATPAARYAMMSGRAAIPGVGDVRTALKNANAYDRIYSKYDWGNSGRGSNVGGVK